MTNVLDLAKAIATSSPKIRAYAIEQATQFNTLVDKVATLGIGIVGPAGPKGDTGATGPAGTGSSSSIGLYVKDFGAVGNDSTDDTAAIQRALDAAIYRPVYIGNCHKITSPLKLNEGQYIIGGFGSGGSSPNAGAALNYYGPDGTNCIEMKGPDLSRVWIEGLHIRDKRVGATGGDGINLWRPKNHVVVKRCSILGWANDAIAVWAESGRDTECIHIEDCWVGGNRYGIYLKGMSNNVTIAHIMSDGLTGENNQKAVIHLDYTLRGGVCVAISAIKLETNQGCHVLEVADNFRGSLSVAGLSMRGIAGNAGGDVVHILGTGEGRAISLTGLNSVSVNGDQKVCKSFVNDNGTLYGNGTDDRAWAQWISGNKH